ncbi:MAG: cysteine desulfurase [Clostridia bacterium]|nr:cysteine desulfurase [Clostridia bacterium]
MIYFDNSASSPLTEEVKAVWLEAMEIFANPSSLHSLGFEAEKRLRAARNHVAASIGADPSEIYFTSGGTEADNTAVFGAAKKLRREGNRILTTDSEHPAVSECMKALEKEGFEIIYLSTKNGELNLEEVAEAANEKTVLAAVMHTNNETGAIYDIASLSRIVKGKNPRSLVFCDAVQGYMKSDVIPKRLGVDLLSLSSHKIHGPKGVGALYMKKGLQLPPFLLGGGQEKGFRSGTENLPGILAFGEAARQGFEKRNENREQMTAVRSRIMELLEGEEKISFHIPKNPSPHVLSMSVAGFRSEVLLHMLSEKGVFVSSGSACSSKKGKSPVLESFGLSHKESDSTVRLSFSHLNTVAEAEEFVRILKEVMN